MNRAIEASVTACVICGSPLAAWRPLGGVLCRSPQCAGRHTSLAAQAKCVHCTRPLTPAQMAAGVCSSPACRSEVLRERRLKGTAREQAEMVVLLRRRQHSAAQRAIPAEQRASYRVAVLPYNTDRPSRLPAERRALHTEHLRTCLAEARAAISAAPWRREPQHALHTSEVPADSRSPAQRAEAALLLEGCAACRGKCCREGGNHAFVTSELLEAYLRRFPLADDEAVVAHYLSHLVEKTMTHGCVYQGPGGCTLAPELRADICHRFHCTGLLMLKGQFAEAEPKRAYMVHRRGEGFTGDRFVEIVEPTHPTGADVA